MGAATEMVRLDTLPKDTVDKLLELAEGGGSGGGVLVVHDVDGTLDKTWQEIFDADTCILQFVKTEIMHNQSLVYEVKQKGGKYSVKALYWDGEAISEAVYTTPSADGYPTSAV